MALSARRNRGGSADYDTVLVDFAGRVTLRSSLDARTVSFRAPDIQRVTAQGATTKLQYFSPSTGGGVSVVISMTVEQVKAAFMRDYGKITWKDG